MTAQQASYESFIELGHSILSRTDPDSPDTTEINESIDGVNSAWDHAMNQLGERASTLAEMLGISTKFYELVEALGAGLQDLGENVERLENEGVGGSLAEQQEQLEVTFVFVRFFCFCFYILIFFSHKCSQQKITPKIKIDTS